MRRVTTTRAFVAGILILTMALSMGLLFGAQGSYVKLTAPAAKAKVKGIITVSADLRGSKQGNYAILVVDRDRPGSTNSFPCSFDLDTRELTDGPHQLLVEAYDDSGLIATSKPVTILVGNRPGAVTTVARPRPATVATRPAPHRTVVLAPAKSVPARTTLPPALPTARRAREATRVTPVQAAGAGTTAPLAPAKTVAGVTGAAPRTAGAAPGADTAVAVAPAELGRGPAPEPTRTAATAPRVPRNSRAAEATARPAASTDARTALPPATKAAQLRPATTHGHTVFLNGHAVEFDVVPVVKAGRLHGGFRALFANAGGQVTWRDDTRTARSVSRALTVEVPTGSRIARVNGRGVDMGSTAQLTSGRLIIPVRFFADATGATVAWDNTTGIARLSVVPEAVALKPE